MNQKVKKQVNDRMLTIVSKMGELEDIVLHNEGDFSELPQSWQDMKQELEQWIMSNQ